MNESIAITLAKDIGALRKDVDALKLKNYWNNLYLKDESTVTIDSGEITTRKAHVVLESEAGVSDELYYIYPESSGKVIQLRPLTGHSITIMPYTAGGNIDMMGSGNGRVFDDPQDSVLLVYSEEAGHWVEADVKYLDGLAGVVITSPADDEVLTYNIGSGVWENAAIGSIAGDYLLKSDFDDMQFFGFLNHSETSISFDDGTYTFTLTDTGSGWSYWRSGLKYTISGNKTVQIGGGAPIDGTHYYIYIDATDGTLTSSTSEWTLTDSKVPVASIYWHSGLTPKYILFEERHQSTWTQSIERYMHATDGTRYISGAALSGYTLSTDTNAAKAFAISEGVIADQDIFLTIAALAEPDGDTDAYYVMYRSAGVWVWELSEMPFRYTAASYIEYDNAGTMTTGATQKFYNTFLMLVNTTGGLRHVIIPGQTEFSTANAAYGEAFTSLSLPSIPLDEGVVVWQLTWASNAAYSSRGKVVLNRVEQESVSLSSVAISSSTIHNSLSGLQGGAANEYFHLTEAEYLALAGGGTFLGLTDTPGSFAGEAYNLAFVNPAENAIEFTDVPYLNAVYARSASGLYIYDDGGNLGIFVADGGNVGISTSDIENWDGAFRALTLGQSSAIIYDTSGSYRIIGLVSNAYFSGGTWYRRTADPAAIVTAEEGYIYLSNAATGAADSSFTWSVRLAVDPSGNVGIGTTDIEAWHSSFRAIQLSAQPAIMWSNASSGLYLVNNAYYDGSWKRRTANGTSIIDCSPESIFFSIGATGSADAATGHRSFGIVAANGGTVPSTTTTPDRFHFGDLTLASYWPEVGFNSYYDGAAGVSKRVRAEFAAHIGIDYTNDRLVFQTVASGAAGGTITWIEGLSLDTASTTVWGTEASDAILNLFADQGDDNADRWRFRVDQSTNEFSIETYTGSWGQSFLINAGGGPISTVRQIIYQGSATGAAPPVALNQQDTSEEFIDFQATIGAGNPIDTAALGTYYGKVRVAVNGTFKYMALYNS